MIRRKLIRSVRAELSSIADPDKAAQMQSYMKSAMPFYGINKPERAKISKSLCQEQPLVNLVDFMDTLLALWRGAKRREERYVALDLAAHRVHKHHQVLETLSMYEEMITTGAWWDLVDEIASHRIGALLESFTPDMQPVVLGWSRSDDLWLRRTSIICQLRRKEHLDRELLYACIEPNLDRKEFFLRKAIGWALRDLAWSDPDEVVRYVREKGERLSPLSRREALKNVNRE